MNLDAVKTYILAFLVLTSLFLTLAIWNYQPNLEPLTGDTEFVNEVDLGGEEEIKRTIIKPDKVVFLINDQLYSFTSPLENDRFYEEIQSWLLSDYQVSSSTGRPENNYQVEIVFPSILPVEIIKNIFNLNEDQQEPLPNWSFQRMFILLNEETSSLELMFLSIDGRQELKYTVSNTESYNLLWSYFENPNDLSEVVQFGSMTSPIYIPKNKTEVRIRSLAVKTIDETLLIDDLFQNPSLISTNFGGSYYTDGQRRLGVLDEGRIMEFINPIHSQEKQKDPIDLLDLSLNNINAHNGWTNDFHLVDINIGQEVIRYRMFYDGYPVFGSNDVSVIEQEWRNIDLYLYRRPLFSISNLPGGKTIELIAGTEVIDYLENSGDYNYSNINDIQIGYKIADFDTASYTLTLYPSWYMNYNGIWLEIRMNEIIEFLGGGS